MLPLPTARWHRCFAMSLLACLLMAACADSPSNVNSSKPIPTKKKTKDAIKRNEIVPGLPLPKNSHKSLIFDLRMARSFRQSVDLYGRVLQKIHTFSDGSKITVEYSWDGASNGCLGVKALVGSTVIAEANQIRVLVEDNHVQAFEAEEIHYVDGKTVYKGLVRFAPVPAIGGKIGEWPKEGVKAYEVFSEWCSYSFM